MKRSTAKRLAKKFDRLVADRDLALRSALCALPEYRKAIRAERDLFVKASVELRRVAEAKKGRK